MFLSPSGSSNATRFDNARRTATRGPPFTPPVSHVVDRRVRRYRCAEIVTWEPSLSVIVFG